MNQKQPPKQAGAGSPPSQTPTPEPHTVRPANTEADAAQGPRERAYRAALEAIANGRPLEVLIAEAALERKSLTGRRRLFNAAGKNLASITALVIAIAGFTFTVFQFVENYTQKKGELKMARVESLNKLIPQLTSENVDTRRYASSILLALASASASDPEEFKRLVDNLSRIGNAETLEALSTIPEYDDGEKANLRRSAAESYAARAEYNRRAMALAASSKEPDAFSKERLYRDAARADAERSLSLDPDNPRALSQRSALLQEDDAQSKDALEGFERVIKVFDEKTYPMDVEIYLRAHVRRLGVLYYRENNIAKGEANASPSPALCEEFKKTKAKYDNSTQTIDMKDDILVLFEPCLR